MFKDFKTVLEFIIWIIVGYHLCNSFGFIGGLLIMIVVVPILIILWYCLCWLVGLIFGAGVLAVEKLTEEKFDDIDDTDEK